MLPNHHISSHCVNTSTCPVDVSASCFHCAPQDSLLVVPPLQAQWGRNCIFVPYFYAAAETEGLWFITLAPTVRTNYNSLNTLQFIFRLEDNGLGELETGEQGGDTL